MKASRAQKQTSVGNNPKERVAFKNIIYIICLFKAKNKERRKAILEIPVAPKLEETSAQNTRDADVDLEALQVELEYVDNNLNKQTNLVKELTTQVQKLSNKNKNLTETNENLYKKLRNLTNKKESVEAELKMCNFRIEELQIVVRLQRKGNKALETESELAKDDAKNNASIAVRDFHCFCLFGQIQPGVIAILILLHFI